LKISNSFLFFLSLNTVTDSRSKITKLIFHIVFERLGIGSLNKLFVEAELTQAQSYGLDCRNVFQATYCKPKDSDDSNLLVLLNNIQMVAMLLITM